MPRLYADLHCHPTMYGFNRLRNSAAEQNPDLFHPWAEQPSDTSAMARGVRAAGYSQCDVAKLAKSGTRIVFGSITPIERGFLEFHSEEGHEHHPFVPELIRLFTGQTLARAGARLLANEGLSAAGELTRILKNRGPLRVYLQKAFLKYGLARIRYMMSPEYDYWDEFKAEYEFWRSRDGVQSQGEVALPDGRGGRRTETISGCYHVIRSPEQYDEVVASERDIAFLLTIEGGHVITMSPACKRVPDELIFSRIRELKALEYPLFFITLAHHFDNGICGHAHSIPDIAQLVMSQKKRLHAGFEREGDLGLRVARALYGVDEDLEDLDERRILIDFKHLSAQSRKELYEEVVEPYNRRHATGDVGDGGGRKTLDALIRNGDREDDHYHAGPYYAWNINIADEDVRMVHDSRGLIGLVFDQRVCGVAPREKVADDMWSVLVRNQIFGMVDAVVLDQNRSDDDRKRVWDCICLGTDYDGMIDPLTRYPTALDLDQFAEDLRAELHAHRHTRFIEEIGVDTLVDKICWKNADAFVRRHLPAACGVS